MKTGILQQRYVITKDYTLVSQDVSVSIDIFETSSVTVSLGTNVVSVFQEFEFEKGSGSSTIIKLLINSR